MYIPILHEAPDGGIIKDVCMYSRAGASLTGPFEYLEIISASCLISNKAESSQKQK